MGTSRQDGLDTSGRASGKCRRRFGSRQRTRAPAVLELPPRKHRPAWLDRRSTPLARIERRWVPERRHGNRVSWRSCHTRRRAASATQ